MIQGLTPARLEYWMDLNCVLSQANWAARPAYVEGVDRPLPLIYAANGGENNGEDDARQEAVESGCSNLRGLPAGQHRRSLGGFLRSPGGHMTATRNFLALDLGASSGRAVIGRFDGERLALEEVHRFANGPVRLPTASGSSIHWDSLDQFAQVKAGHGEGGGVLRQRGLVSVGIDTWGVDYGLLDAAGELLGNGYPLPRRADGGHAGARCSQIVPREEVFRQTGIQFMDLNTLYQLFAARGTAALDAATSACSSRPTC